MRRQARKLCASCDQGNDGIKNTLQEDELAE
jgi:hypothetical protein